jgi:transcriptional regulator with XRE-family HTH domain
MSPSQTKTFGAHIAEARKALQMSQKELAARILREDDQQPISPQYLNDIERDRRNPSSDFLIQQFAKVLKIDADYLHYLAGRLPEEIRQRHLPEDVVKEAFTAFRRPQGKR